MNRKQLAGVFLLLASCAYGNAPVGEPTASRIYERFARNHSEPTLRYYNVQGSPGLRLWVRSTDSGGVGVRSKAVVRILEPASVRGLTHLFIENDDTPSDHFEYGPRKRRVKQVELCSEFAETGLSICDFLPWPREAKTTGLPDGEIDGVPVHVIDVELITVPRYPKRRVSVTQDRFLPLRIQFMDERGVEVRRWSVDSAGIELWENLVTGSETRLALESSEQAPRDPRWSPGDFDSYPRGDFWIEGDEKPGTD